MTQPPLPQLPTNPTGDPANVAGMPVTSQALGKPLPDTGGQLAGQLAGQMAPGLTKEQQASFSVIDKALPANPFKALVENVKLGPLNPQETLQLTALSKQLYNNGMLSKVIESAGNAVMQYVEAKTVIQGAIQEQMVQELKTIRDDLKPLVTVLPGGTAQMKIPPSMQLPSMTGQLMPGVSPQTAQAMTRLVTQSAAGALQEFLAPGLTTPLTEAQNKAQNWVTQLIALKINTANAKEVQVVIPQEALTSNMSMQQLNVAKQSIMAALQQTHEEFQLLFKTAEKMGLNTAVINAFKFAPQQALALMRNIPFTESSLVLAFLGVWVANKKTVETALMQQPFDLMTLRRDAIKAVIATLTDMTGRPLLGQDQKFSLIEQLLNAMPSILNYTTIGQLLSELEAEAQALARNVAIQRMLLLQAAKEIIIIASGHPNPYYQSVGVLHEELDILANKLMLMLPKQPQEITDRLHLELVREIRDALQAVKMDNPRLFRDVLRYHPRNFVFLIYTDSPLIEDLLLPKVPEAIFTEEKLTLFSLMLEKLSEMPEFTKYQPKVLVKIVQEGKGDLSQALSKDFVKVAYYAATECISLLKAELAEPFKITLKTLSE